VGYFKVLFQIFLQSLRKTTKTSEYETEYRTEESSERIILKFTLWQDINQISRTPPLTSRVPEPTLSYPPMPAS
jgi:hypothetical protein